MSPIMMEAQGVIEGMRFAVTKGWKSVIIELDCQKLVNDLNKNNRIEAELGILYDNIRSFIPNFESCSFAFVNRNANLIAHVLAKRAQSLSESEVWTCEPPSFIDRLRP